VVWRTLFTPICKAYIWLYVGYDIEWRWLTWLFGEIGGRAYHSQDKAA
jgi:hypothetical protein